MTNIMIDEIIKKQLEQYARSLRQQNIPVQKMFLYGSWARGKQNQWSDIDVAVVSKQFGKDRIDEMVTLRMAALPINPAISPFPMRLEDLEDRFGTVANAVKKDGREVVV